MTTQREIAAQLGLPIHPPKVEVFDLANKTNTDPKGFVRTVHEYRIAPFGLYMARSMAGHPRLNHVESWLLPVLGIRANKFEYRPGCALDQDYYIDIVHIESGTDRWRSFDHYLDITVRTGRGAEVLDTDEFLVATRADLLEPEVAERALHNTYRAVNGLARHDFDLDAWLRTQDIALTWMPQPGDSATRSS